MIKITCVNKESLKIKSQDENCKFYFICSLLIFFLFCILNFFINKNSQNEKCSKDINYLEDIKSLENTSYYAPEFSEEIFNDQSKEKDYDEKDFKEENNTSDIPINFSLDTTESTNQEKLSQSLINTENDLIKDYNNKNNDCDTSLHNDLHYEQNQNLSLDLEKEKQENSDFVKILNNLYNVEKSTNPSSINPSLNSFDENSFDEDFCSKFLKAELNENQNNNFQNEDLYAPSLVVD